MGRAFFASHLATASVMLLTCSVWLLPHLKCSYYKKLMQWISAVVQIWEREGIEREAQTSPTGSSSTQPFLIWMGFSRAFEDWCTVCSKFQGKLKKVLVQKSPRINESFKNSWHEVSWGFIKLAPMQPQFTTFPVMFNIIPELLWCLIFLEPSECLDTGLVCRRLY